MIVSFNSLARAELQSAVRWLAANASPETATDLQADFWRTIDRIVERPLIGTPGVRNTRRVLLHRFRYAVVYRIEGDAVRVLAVIHQHRRPGYWGRRR